MDQDLDERLNKIEVAIQTLIHRLDTVEQKVTQSESSQTHQWSRGNYPPVPPSPYNSAEPQGVPAQSNNEQKSEPLGYIPPAVKTDAAITADWMQVLKDVVPKANAGTVPAAPKPQVATADDLEYKLGINGLLRGGALVVAVAILFLAAMMIGRGLVTPQVQFAGELILCIAMIGVGIWKHQEREDFGQLMVGLGSFGLYASFAGAHTYKHLFEGETLIVLYVLLSLANLGYSQFRASKTFLILGLFGGLCAAILPITKQNVLLGLGLHFLIAIPTAVVIIRNRWEDMSVLTWFVSVGALMPAVTSDFHQAYRVGALYLTAGLALVSYGKTQKEESFDPLAIAQLLILLVTGGTAIAIDNGFKGSLHCLALVGVGVASAYLIRSNERCSKMTLLGSLSVLCFITPLGFNQGVATSLYGVTALAFVIAMYRIKDSFWQTSALVFAGLLYSLSVVAYLFSPIKQTVNVAFFNKPIELTLIAIHLATIIGLARYLFGKLEKDMKDGIAFLAGAITILYALRVNFLLAGTGGAGLSAEDAMHIGVSICGIGTTVFALWLRNLGARVLTYLMATIGFLGTLIDEPTGRPLWLFPFLSIASGVNILLIYRKLPMLENPKPTSDYHHYLTGFCLSSILVHLSYFVAQFKMFSLNADGTALFTLGLISVAMSVMLLRERSIRWTALSGTAIFICFLFTLGNGTVQPLTGIATAQNWLHPVMLVFIFFGLIAHYVATPFQKEMEQVFTGILVLPGWVAWTLLFQDLFGAKSKLESIITLACISYAVFLIVAGFKLNQRLLRYWSLFIFAVTVFKVFTIDLEALDSMVRVFILMVLGFGMIGGGYWYILWRRSLTPPHDDQS